ncbi:ATP-binding protein [Pseudoalteromonas sp. OOF1S-7]|uniref:hybrid sensor histidine kinase/response regulator transcription factor n=1 Tax=Pseudoalteromonas sp. OOF1S-7 TaxID=2917757 RepID=UPI001EF57C0C|nr:ATP-binding protein [Pseudoalteromonas sp. OOF1S-7]MCG7535191.1 response regulator [Pseudoalteromonas sp. OOF1S-7]
MTHVLNTALLRPITVALILLLQLNLAVLANTYTTLTVADGLPSNRVFDIERDHRGFAWFATDKGLARYDGARIEVFSRYHTPRLSQSLWVRDILFDKQQQLWVAGKQGLEVLSPQAEHFQSIRVPKRTEPLNIYALYKSENGQLWAGAADGLYLLEQGSLTPILTKLNGQPVNFKILSITQAQEKTLLLATSRGLYLFDPASTVVTPITNLTGAPVIADKLWTLPDSQIWVAMHGIGLGRYHPEQRTVELIYKDPNEFDTVGYIFDLHRENNELRAASLNAGLLYLSTDTINRTPSLPPLLSLFRDNNLNMYGTFSEGVIIETLNHQAINNFSFTHPSDTGTYEVNQLVQTDEHLWIADQLAGLCQYTLTGLFLNCVASESHSAQALAPSKDGSLWAAMYHELLLLDPSSAIVKARYPLAERGIAEAINTLSQSADGALWLAHSFDGLSRFDPDTRTTTRFTSANSQLLSDQVHHLAIRQGKIWLATAQGLQAYSFNTAQFEHVVSPASQPFHAVYAVTPGPDNKLWLQTDRGLRAYDPDLQHWQNLPEPLSRLSNTSLVFDEHNTVWVASDKGVWHWLGDNKTLAFYNHGDGLFKNGYLEGVSARSKSTAIFASTEGVTRISTDKLHAVNAQPQISALSITALNGSEQHFYTTSSVPEIDPKHASLRFQIANGDLINQTKQAFRYQLSGLTETWVELGNEHTLIVPRLPWGTYTLRLKGTNNQGNWSEQISELHFTVRTPWYATASAKVSYVLLSIITIYLAYRLRIRSLQRRQQQLEDTIAAHTRTMRAQNNQLEAAQAQRAALLKTLSHELMTPVTLIQGPAEQLRTSSSEVQRNQMANLVISNTKRLKVMIEHLMQLSSHSQPSDSVTPDAWQHYDLATLVKEQVQSFEPLIQSKSMHCSAKLESGLKVSSPPDQLQQLISNLLSNAIKYSYEGGEINLLLGPDETAQHAVLTIADQGVGIAQADHERIFEPEYRTKHGSEFASGQGLGLSRVRELVTQLSGQIQLESSISKGTTFTVRLPIIDCHNNVQPHFDVSAPPQPTSLSRSILLIDDTPDMLAFVHSILAADYRVLTASDGETGLALARAQLPDMVISDVMMPGIDGFELTQRLKSDPLTAHVPVMLITANLNEEKHLQGLKLQADDYLTKPFNLEAFKLKISNTFALIESTQAKLKQQFRFNEDTHNHNADAKQPHGDQAIKAKTPKDLFADNPATVTFLEQLESVLYELYSEPSLTVAVVAKEMALSERQLHRKLTSVTSFGANEYLRQYRLYRALPLLLSGLSVAQSAEQCGFNSPSYFSACFKKQFGLTAKAYVQLPQSK